MKNLIKLTALTIATAATPVFAGGHMSAPSLPDGLSLGADYISRSFDITAPGVADQDGSMTGYRLEAEMDLDNDIVAFGSYAALDGEIASTDTEVSSYSVGARYDAVKDDAMTLGFGGYYTSTTVTSAGVEGDAETSKTAFARASYALTPELTAVGVGSYNIDDEDYGWNVGAEYAISDNMKVVGSYSMDEDEDGAATIKHSTMTIGIKTTF